MIKNDKSCPFCGLEGEHIRGCNVHSVAPAQDVKDREHRAALQKKKYENTKRWGKPKAEEEK